MEFPLSGSLFEEGLHCSGEANGHDHLIGMDVLQSLGCDVLRCPFCKKPVFQEKYDTAILQHRQTLQKTERDVHPSLDCPPSRPW